VWQALTSAPGRVCGAFSTRSTRRPSSRAHVKGHLKNAKTPPPGHLPATVLLCPARAQEGQGKTEKPLPDRLKCVPSRRDGSGQGIGSLRHSSASLTADLGYSEPTIAALVGHKGQAITSRYVHSTDGRRVPRRGRRGGGPHGRADGRGQALGGRSATACGAVTFDRGR
jgi:hypothetical protein